MKPADTNKPHLVITVGIPCSGKSFFAEHFAETFKAPLISFDRIKLESTSKDGNFSLDNMITNNIASHMISEVLKTGRTVVYEGQTDSRSDRQAIAKKAKEAGYEPLFVWIQTELAAAKRRAIGNKKYKSFDQFDLRLKKFSAPHASEKAIVISGKHTYPSQLKIVLKHLTKPASNVNMASSVRSTAKRNYLIR